MNGILTEIPDAPTLRDLYHLLAVTAQQIANYGQELKGLRVELTRLIAQQADNIRVHDDRIVQIEQDIASVRIEIEALKAWQLAHQFTCPYIGGSGREMARTQLRALLARHFSPDELKDVAFELSIDADALRGDTIAEQARELVNYAERHNRILPLTAICQRLRPSVAWPLAYD